MPSPPVLLIRNSNLQDVGGAERYPIYLSQILTSKGYSPHYLTANKHTRKLASKAIKNVHWSPWLKFQNFSGLRIFLTPLYLVWQIFLFFWFVVMIIRYRPVALHPQSRDDFIAATLAGRILRRKIVWTDHADLKYIYANHQIWYKNPIGKLVFWVSKLAHKVIIVSNSEKNLIEQSLSKLVPTNYKVVYNGVPDYTSAQSDTPARKDDGIVFVSTSRLVTAKGIGEVIAAFKSLPKTSKAKLLLIGEGPESGRFRQLAGNAQNIAFAGFQNDVYPYLAASDVFVQPSYHEGLSVSMIEACMFGLPIIACDAGGNPEIVDDKETGLLVPVKDSNALREAVLKLENNATLRKSMGSKGRKIYEQRFNFETIVEQQVIPTYKS